VPTLKCVDPDCGWEWSVRSELAIGEECPDCGGDSTVLDAYDDEVDQPSDAGSGGAAPRIPFARERARGILRSAGITSPPIAVRDLVEGAGLRVRERAALGSLRGRLVGNAIELVATDREEVKRFTLGHELGHHHLETEHKDGSPAEIEANHFANELLVPGDLLRAALKRQTSTRGLAVEFQVSRQVLELAAQYHRVKDRLTT
jgi:IrrE N-terminal-like domain